jgi:SET domain-containing protein
MKKKTAVISIPKKGRGIVATAKIKAGEVVIIDHLMLISPIRNNCATIRSHVMHFDSKNDCIMLGESTLLNHSFDPNVEFLIDTNKETSMVLIVALKDIRKNTELLVNYGDSYSYSWIPK